MAGETVEFPCAVTGAKVGMSHNSSLFLECGADGQFPVVSEFCEVRFGVKMFLLGCENSA